MCLSSPGDNNALGGLMEASGSVILNQQRIQGIVADREGVPLITDCCCWSRAHTSAGLVDSLGAL